MKKFLKFSFAAFALILVITAVSNSSKGTSTPSTSTSTPSAQVAPSTSTPSTSTPSTDTSVTTGQQNALDSAKSYLQMGSGFSQHSLMDQLTSSAGEGFSQADAQYAVSNAGADWNAQAVESAQGYLNSGSFSRSSLMEQLTSSAGEGFTQAQAQYAVGQVYH